MPQRHVYCEPAEFQTLEMASECDNVALAVFLLEAVLPRQPRDHAVYGQKIQNAQSLYDHRHTRCRRAVILKASGKMRLCCVEGGDSRNGKILDSGVCLTALNGQRQ